MYRNLGVQCNKEDFSSKVNGLVQVQKRREEVESRTMGDSLKFHPRRIIFPVGIGSYDLV